MISCAAEAKQLRLEITGLLEALLQGNSANLNLMLRGWRDEDADLCREALNSTRDSRDPNISMRRCSIECVLQYMGSNYSDCCIAASRGQRLAQAIGDVYFYVLYNIIEAFALLHLGEWGRLQQSVAAALSMTNKNANRQASVLCQMSIAWLHAEAFDFEGARKRCEEALDSTVEANPFVFFLGRNLLAKACLGLRDLPAAFAQFADITHRIEVEGDVMETTIYPHFHHNLCEYWIAVGDMTCARQQATKLYEMAKGPPERTYLALSHRLLAKIAIAEENFAQAQAHLSRAIAIVEDAELPLAAWRVYAMAAQLSEFLGDLKEAAQFRSSSKRVICAMADTLEPNDPVCSSLLAGFAAETRSCAQPFVRGTTVAHNLMNPQKIS
jgi:tetratricopeptide (TPR) repeat protein